MNYKSMFFLFCLILCASAMAQHKWDSAYRIDYSETIRSYPEKSIYIYDQLDSLECINNYLLKDSLKGWKLDSRILYSGDELNPKVNYQGYTENNSWETYELESETYIEDSLKRCIHKSYCHKYINFKLPTIDSFVTSYSYDKAGNEYTKFECYKNGVFEKSKTEIEFTYYDAKKREIKFISKKWNSNVNKTEWRIRE